MENLHGTIHGRSELVAELYLSIVNYEYITVMKDCE